MVVNVHGRVASVDLQTVTSTWLRFQVDERARNLERFVQLRFDGLRLERHLTLTNHYYIYALCCILGGGAA